MWDFWYNKDMETRKNPLVNGQYYHIFNRSISGYIIFNNSDDYLRMLNIIDLCRFVDFKYKFSEFDVLSLKKQSLIITELKESSQALVEIVAYCLMPTHIHLILKQIEDKGITKYLARISNSYTRFFNIKHKRKGPLWEGHFKNVLVDSDEQLLHLTRYIHLNPCSASLVENPKDWAYSSCCEYITLDDQQGKICSFSDIISIPPKDYIRFVQDRKSYQKEISLIKKIIIDNYSG